MSDGNLICKCGDVLVKGADVFHPDDYAGEGGCFWNVEDNEGNCDHNSTVTKADIIFPKPAAPDTPLPCAGDSPPYDCDCPDCMAYDEQVDQAVSRHIEELDQAEADSAAQAIAMMEGEFPPAYDNGPNPLGADY